MTTSFYRLKLILLKFISLFFIFFLTFLVSFWSQIKCYKRIRICLLDKQVSFLDQNLARM